MRRQTQDYLEAVLALVCEHTGLSPKLLRGPSRRIKTVQARHLAISLAAWHGVNKASLAELAAFFHKDRSSIYHALRAHASRVSLTPAGALAVAWEQLKEETRKMLDIEERDQVLDAMRRLHSRRHLRMSTLVAQGHLSSLACATESRQLTNLLRRLEHQLLGVEMELPAEFDFPQWQLSRLLENHRLRLRAEGDLQEASWIARAQEVLSLDTQTLELPEEEPESAPEPPPAPQEEEAATEEELKAFQQEAEQEIALEEESVRAELAEEDDEDDGARLLMPPVGLILPRFALYDEPRGPEDPTP